MGLVGFNVTNLVKPALVSLYYKQEINAFYLQLTDLSAANTCFFLADLCQCSYHIPSRQLAVCVYGYT